MRLRSIGALALLAFGGALAQAQPACGTVPIYGRCEFVFEMNAEEMKAHPDPYRTVQLRAEFRSPKHRTFLMPGFWDGGNRIVLRFAPMDDGVWDYRVTTNLKRFDGATGQFTAEPSDTPGFIRPRNVHHWSHLERDVPHLWMGDTLLGLAGIGDEEFARYSDARARQKFTHVRAAVLDAEGRVFAGGQPDAAHFRRLDARIAALNAKGIVADLILGWGNDQATKLFPMAADRERYLRYIVARYAPFNVTWQLFHDFESYTQPREITKQMGEDLKRLDPFSHPRSTGTAGTSAPLFADGWMDHVLHATGEDAVGAIEHQLFEAPFVNTWFGVEDRSAGRANSAEVPADEIRRRLWRTTMNGQYPTYANRDTAAAPGDRAFDAGQLDSPGTKFMTVWFDFFSKTRFWELEPYFDLDGGRAVALPETEYIVYVEKPQGPVEVRVVKKTYDVRWFDPVNGQYHGKPQEIKSDKIVVEPPSRTQDWVLHISREGRKEGMLRSYKFESRRNLMQVVEADLKKVPFEIVAPAGDEISLRTPPPYEAKLTRQTRGTRTMMYLWTGEVSSDGGGYRILGSGESGTLRIPVGIGRKFPALLNVRLYGMNANGKVYQLDRVYHLNQ